MQEQAKKLLLVKHEDIRGSFMRLFDSQWSGGAIEQVSISSNPEPQTLRGLHAMQLSANEYKTVSCVAGKVMDVLVDIRRNSELYLKPQYFILDSSEPSVLVIPPGHLHGFMTLQVNSTVLYAMTAKFDSTLEIGVRWDDPLLKIQWPEQPRIVSERDKSFPLLSQAPEL
jgi:dTDP-4-dehydrorhamnose 3,5-epimerase